MMGTARVMSPAGWDVVVSVSHKALSPREARRAHCASTREVNRGYVSDHITKARGSQS